ncbi:hypothetical protein [Metabacillus sp. SLBN-84]
MASCTNQGSLPAVTVNTILTMVLRIGQPVTVKTPDGGEYDIIWNHQYSEPEVLGLQPGTDVRGITQTAQWLGYLDAQVDWYAQTKRHRQP